MVEHSFEIEGAPPANKLGRGAPSRATQRTWTAQRLSVAAASFTATSSSVSPNPKNTEAAKPGEPLGLTLWEATANFLIGLVGAGLLVLPKNLADVGGISGLLLLMLGTVCVTECALQVDAAITHAELALGRAGRINNYEELAGEALGARGQMLLLLAKNSYFLGVLVVFSLFVTEGFVNLAPGSLKASHVRWLVVYPVFVLGSLVRDLKALAPVQPVVVAATFLMCGCFAAGSLCELSRPGFELFRPGFELFRGSAYDLGTTMATSFFACGGVCSMAPAVRSQMAQPEKCSSAIRAGMAIVFGIYATVMCCGYVAYGSDMEATILETIGRDCQPVQCVIARVAAVGVNVKICFTVPSFVYLVVSVLEAQGSWRACTPLSLPNIACRVSLMTVLFWISTRVPHVRQVIGLLTSSIGIMLACLLPLSICYGMKRRLANSPAAQQVASASEVRDYIVHGFVVLICLFVAYFGIKGSWDDLRKMSGGELE